MAKINTPEIQLLEMGCALGVIKAKGEKVHNVGEVSLYFRGDPA